MALANELRNAMHRPLEQVRQEDELKGLYKAIKQYCIVCAERKGQHYAAGYLLDRHDWECSRDEDRFEAIERPRYEEWADRLELPAHELPYVGNRREREKKEQMIRESVPSAAEIDRLTAKYRAHTQRLRVLLEREGLQVNQLSVVPLYKAYYSVREERKMLSTHYYKVKIISDRVEDMAIRFSVSW